MNDNEVSLTIGGSVFKNWTSFNITTELNTISPAFSVGGGRCTSQNRKQPCTYSHD